MTLRSAVAGLSVVEENRLGYDRDLFPHWVDEDRNGCHTRREVLIAEATSFTGGRGAAVHPHRWTVVFLL